MGKRLLFTLFAILFCSTMFGQNFTPKYEYQPDGTYTEPMTLLAKISFDGAVQNNANLELGVFSNDELRGGCFLMDVFGTGDYLAMTSVFGERGQYFTFKVYDHTPGVETEREWNVSCTFINGDEGMEYMSYNAEGFVDPINPAVINFVTPNHWTPNHTDYQFNFNVIAVVMKDGVEQTDTNLELGAFDANGKVRGSVKLQPQTLLGNTRYYADMLVYGTKGDEITFKLYDHGTGQEFPFNEVNSCVLTEDKDASGNPILGSYLKPLEVNFITAPYVAQIGENKYLSFDAALEAAKDGDNIELLKSIDLGTTTAVIEESINITLGSFSITGTVELANISATITGAENGVTSVTTNVEGYKVVYEDGKYKLVKKLSGEIAYRAYVGDESNRESVKVDLKNIYASESVVVKLYDANTNLLTTTSYKAGGVEAPEYLTCNIVLSGNPSSSWETVINVEKLTVDNYPKKAELLIDGTYIHTFDNILGNATDAAAYQLPAYLALDCVYKAASITKDNVTDYYMTFAAAYEAAQSGDEIVLHDDVLLTTKQTIAKEITINGNNHSIKADETAVWYTTGNPPLNLKQYKTHLLGLNSDNITLKNIVLDCNDNAAGINLYCAQNVTFDNVEIINATKGVAALTVNGSTLTVKTKLVALGNLVAIDIDLGSGVTSALGFNVEDNTVFDLGGKQVKYDSAATIDMDGAVDTNGNPYFAAKDNVYYYTVAQMESRTTAYNGLTLLADVTLADGKTIKFKGTLDLNGHTLNAKLEVTGEATITGEGEIIAEIYLPLGKTLTAKEGLNVTTDEGAFVVYANGTYTSTQAVAKIGATYYASLQAAYEAAQANDEIVLLQNVTLSETMTIEKAITLNLNENTVTGADGAIVFNVKAATTIKNGTVLGNKSGTSSGLIDIYADINLDGVTIETTKIRALAFKESVSGTPSTATLTNCNVTGGFKGYGGSVWEIKSGVYKASSTSITDQLNGTASVSGGTFHYEIDETDCAPGYVVKNNGNGTWTVEYAPAAFVDTDKDGVYDEDVDVLYGNLDQIFADYRTGDVHVVLTKEVVVANNKVDTDVDAHFYITTNVEGGTTMDFLYADPEDVQPYNCVQNMDIAENVTLNVKYFTIYGNFNLKGTVNAFYPFIIAANVNIAEDALFNQNVEGVNSEAIQIKDGAVVTVEGKVEAKYINLYKSDSYTGEQGACLRVTGANAEVNVSSVDLWKGETLLIVENGAKFKANSIKASRGGSIEVDGATIDAAIRLGHDTTDETTLTASGTCTLGQITLATLGSKVVGPEGFEVVSGVNGYGVNYYDEVYSLVQIVTQSYTLYAGWNWFSSYVDINGEAGWENLKTGLGSNAMLVKNQNSMSQYYNTDNIVGWDGTLEETSVKEMYMIRMSADHDLTLTGKLVDPSENPITLHHNGWTWIGYPMNQDLALEDVLKGFNPNAGDRIKSHQGFSQYYDNELYKGWWGTLETMTPGYGYMYYNAGENNATLKYSYPADGSKSELRTNITSENNYWVPASSRYAGNMNIVAMLEADGDNYEIAAFVGGEVRGSARPIYVEPLDAYMFFLTVHGEDVEEMTFKVYDLATGEEYNLNDRMNYTDNAIVGSITEPYIFRGTVGIGETSLSEVNVYPNPTTTGNEINLGTECDTVEVFNALGVKVAEYQNVDTVDALETAGVYVIRITNDGNVQNCRLIVK